MGLLVPKKCIGLQPVGKQWGINNANNGSGSITFPIAFSSLCAIVTGLKTTVAPTYAATITSSNNNGFNYYKIAADRQLYWLACGT